MTRFGNFTVRENTPEVRTYSLDTDACVQAVRLGKMGRVACDIETNGLAEESYEVKLIMVSDDRHAAVLDARNPRHRMAVSDAFDAATEIDFHNTEFDVPPLVHSGAMTLDHIDKIVDTLIWARMAMSDQMGGKRLADLEKSVLGADDLSAEKDRFEQWCKINKMTKSEGFKAARYQDRGYSMYGGWDTIITHRLRDPMLKMVVDLFATHPFGGWGVDREGAEELAWEAQIVNRVMLRRSAKGLAADLDLLQREQDRIADTQSDLAEGMRQFGIDSPTNPGQLIAALEKEGALPEDYPRTEKNKVPSTKGDDLEKLTHRAARLYNEYKDHNKLFQYLESARVMAERTDGRLHPVVGIMKAITGRTSYGGVAVQQFKPEARAAILGDEDLTSLDWSQIEPVLAANFAGDLEPLEVYEQSGDLYTPVSQAANVERGRGKAGLLGDMYGIGLRKLAANLEITEQDAQDIKDRIHAVMPMTDRFVLWATEWARETGCTWTMSGRIIPVYSGAPYRGTNYTIQGSCWDLMSYVLVEMYRRGIADMLHLTMHDELIVGKSIADEVEEIMRTPPRRLIELSRRVPVLRTDRAMLGDRWRTPPKAGCCVCGGDKMMRWTAAGWVCGSHNN